MQSLNKATLAYQLGCRPATMQRDLSQVPVSSVVAQLNQYMKATTTAGFSGKDGVDKKVGESERDAVIFYLMNHAMSVVRQRVGFFEDLGDYLPLVNEYQRQLTHRSTRMFYYLLLICTRESRHCKSNYDGGMWAKLTHEYGKECMSFHTTIKGKGSTGAADVFRESPPKMLLGPYTRFLADIFHNGQYSGGYGGPAWGAVADVLRDFVSGKLTAEMMLDTSFTLAHNNGPIFNKGMLFESFNTSELIRILDVQRSGQIPQMVAAKETTWANDKQIVPLHQLCRGVLGSCMEGYVDWYQVEALGAVGNYHANKKQQDAKYGDSEAAKKAKQLAAEMAAKKEAEAAAVKEKLKAKIQEELGKFIQIMPGVKVKLTEVRK